MPQVSSIWMIRAGDGRQPRIIQRAGIRQAAMPGTPRGASRHGSGHPGSGGCGCPERPLPPFRHHAERRSRSGRTRTLPPIWAVRARRYPALAAARNRGFCGGIHRAQPCPSAGERIARSRRGGRGRTGDLGSCRPGPTPVEPPRGSANVKIAQGKGTRRDTEGEPEPGNGRREQTGERRTKGNQKKAGEGGRTRRANGKPEESPQGEPEDVR